MRIVGNGVSVRRKIIGCARNYANCKSDSTLGHPNGNANIRSTYLSEAISTTIRELSNGSSLKQSAELAAKEGFEALTAWALGFTSVQTMREHEIFLKTKASPEYREWLVSLVAIEHA